MNCVNHNNILTFEPVDETLLSNHSFCLSSRVEMIGVIHSNFWTSCSNPLKLTFILSVLKNRNDWRYRIDCNFWTRWVTPDFVYHSLLIFRWSIILFVRSSFCWLAQKESLKRVQKAPQEDETAGQTSFVKRKGYFQLSEIDSRSSVEFTVASTTCIRRHCGNTKQHGL